MASMVPEIARFVTATIIEFDRLVFSTEAVPEPNAFGVIALNTMDCLKPSSRQFGCPGVQEELQQICQITRR